MNTKRITKTKAVKVSKEILKYFLLAGAILVAASSPYFVLNLKKNISKLKHQNKEKVKSAFQYLKREGLIELSKEGHDICLSLTEKGKKRAGKYQIDDLEIKKPKRWDRKWRLIIFDIPDLKRMERDVFRRKLKEMGFYPLQKSVWIHPFNCQKEIELLRDFLGAGQNDIQFLLAERIENDGYLKRAFNL